MRDSLPEKLSSHARCLLLAGGEGRRLARLARSIYGEPRPKQFCAFDSRCTLFERTVDRALHLFPAERIDAIVSRHHLAYAEPIAARYPGLDLIVQPRGRDTGPGIFYSCAHLAARDPESLVCILPTDHAVSDAGLFMQHVARALEWASSRPRDIVLLGAEPRAPSSDFGWIEPAADDPSPVPRVAAFHEKPPPQEAIRLFSGGALVSTFVLAARVDTLLELLGDALPEWASALARCPLPRPEAIEEAYDRLPPASFSREVLERAAGRLDAVGKGRLRVLRLAGIDWSDLGTEERLHEHMRRIGAAEQVEEPDACCAGQGAHG